MNSFLQELKRKEPLEKIEAIFMDFICKTSIETLKLTEKKMALALSRFLKGRLSQVKGNISFLNILKGLKKKLDMSQLVLFKAFPYFSLLIRDNLGRINQCVQTKQSSLKFCHHQKESSFLLERVGRNLRQLEDPSIQSYALLKQPESMEQKIKEIATGRVLCQNPQCVQCSQVFWKNKEFYNENCLFAKIFGITKQQMGDRIFLRKVVTAVGNCGSGVVLAGVSSNNRNKILGLRPNIESMQNFTGLISEILQTINPRLYPIFQQIAVCCPLSTLNNASSSGLAVYRLTLVSYKPSRLHYSILSTKGFHSIYQVYAFKEDLPELVKPTDDNLYKLMIQKKGQKIINTHYQFCKILPLAPKQDSKILGKFVDPEQLMKNDEELLAKYKNNSLLVVGSVQKDYLAHNFTNILKEKKLLHQIYRPYPNSIECSQRSVWFLSYDTSNQNMKKVAGKYLERGCIFMPIQLCLQVNNNRLKQNSSRYKMFCQRMLEKYPQAMKCLQPVETRKVKTKQGLMDIEIYEFNTTNMAVYAYMVMENLQIRPYFVKPGQFFAK